MSNVDRIKKKVYRFLLAVVCAGLIWYNIKTFGDDAGNGIFASLDNLFFIAVCGIYLFFYYIGLGMVKFFIFLSDPNGYKDIRDTLEESTPDAGQFMLYTAQGLNEVDHSEYKLSQKEKARLNDALRTAELYKYSPEHRYLDQDSRKK